eukprot:m.159148 g.159148  ORF g.159148 m.159148 type:complete len:115 (-) comp53006_c0_seq2:692-1036(-)
MLRKMNTTSARMCCEVSRNAILSMLSFVSFSRDICFGFLSTAALTQLAGTDIDHAAPPLAHQGTCLLASIFSLTHSCSILPVCERCGYFLLGLDIFRTRTRGSGLMLGDLSSLC